MKFVMQSFLFVRTLIFYLGYAVGVICIGTAAFILGHFMPRERITALVSTFSYYALWLARIICGIRYEVVGLENLPKTPCLVASNHQSAWETYFAGQVFQPQAPVLKQELTNIPFFSWGLRPLEPIALDRSKPTQALKQLLRQGSERLQQGWWVVIFPEGTRVRRNQPSRYTKGAAMLAVRAGVPLLPMAHNAGRYWPAGEFRKYPGCIRVEIGTPIPTNGRSAEEVHQEMEAWIRATAGRLDQASQAAIEQPGA